MGMSTDAMLAVATAGCSGRRLSVGAVALPLPLLLLWIAVPSPLTCSGAGDLGGVQARCVRVGMTVVGPIILVAGIDASTTGVTHKAADTGVRLIEDAGSRGAKTRD